MDEQTTNAQPSETQAQSAAPVGQLKTNRGLLKLILLSIVTLGIYALVFFCGVTSDINVIASRYDGKKTMHFALLIFVLTPITGGIAYFVWMHRLSNRIGGELSRRGIDFKLSAADFWIWDVLLSVIIVGPFIFLHKFCASMNKLSEHYNVNG